MWLAMEYETLFPPRREKSSLCESKKIYVKHQLYVTSSKDPWVIAVAPVGLFASALPPPWSLCSTAHRVSLLRLCTEASEETQNFCGVLRLSLWPPLPPLIPPSLHCSHTGVLALPLPPTCQTSAVSGPLHCLFPLLGTVWFQKPTLLIPLLYQTGLPWPPYLKQHLHILCSLLYFFSLSTCCWHHIPAHSLSPFTRLSLPREQGLHFIHCFVPGAKNSDGT